jgi:peptidoglycan/LPS O-acetylase OafA/YrhL
LRRNIGLDVVRGGAITMVVLFHAPIALPGKGIFEMLSVDLFFSLSGLLIAQMVFERFNLIATPRDFRLFMLNRWIRTFPLYYLFILVNIGLVALGPFLRAHYPGTPTGTDAVPNLLPYLFFLQNATQGGSLYHNWFPVSWSLCVEEWFYLLLALTLLVLPGRARTSARAWMIGFLGLIAATLLARVIVLFAWDRGTLSFDDGYRGVMLLRADAFVYGGAVYLWQRHMRGCAASRLAWLNRLAALAGLLVIAASWLLRHGSGDGAWTKLLVPSSVPLAAALLLPWFSTLRLAAGGPAGRAATFLSTRTYAIYLCHIPLQYLFFCVLAPSLPTYALFLAGMLAVAHLLYVHIERPVMALRPLSASHRSGIGFAALAEPPAPVD